VSVAVLPSVFSGPTSSAQTGVAPWGLAVSATKTYVANQGSNTVTVIDRADPSATPITITVAASPTAIALGPAGSNRAYVAGDTAVSVIDTATNTVIATMTTGGGPSYGIAVSPTGQRLYVGMTGTNRVAVIDTTTTTPTVLGTVAVGSVPAGVAVSADGSRLYVTNFASNNVSVIDTATTTVIRTIAVGNNPVGIAVSPDGTRVYVANYASNTVSVLNPTAATPLVASVTGVAGPVGLTAGPDGTLVYVANSNDTVSVINTSTNTVVRTITTDSQPEAQLQSIAVSPDGTQVYVSDLADRTVRILAIVPGSVKN
jgi:YVTN family beta-propeller protein